MRTRQFAASLLLAALSTACGSAATDPQADVPFQCTPKTGAVGDRLLSLSSGGLERTSRLHVPASYDPTQGAMLVLSFHGFIGTAERNESRVQMIPLSDRDGFLIAYPSGAFPQPNSGWNGGACCGVSVTTGVDDVAFVRDLIDEISAEYCVDPKRIYATGYSNGGYMSQRLGCELSDRIAAIAPVAGLLGIPGESCQPEHPLSVLVFHGTADTRVPFGGGAFEDPPDVFAAPYGGLSVPAATSLWRDRNECDSAGETTYQNGAATCESWSCRTGTTVEQCTIDGGDHSWPGSANGSPDIAASERIIEFFQAHPRP